LVYTLQIIQRNEFVLAVYNKKIIFPNLYHSQQYTGHPGSAYLLQEIKTNFVITNVHTSRF